MHTIIKIAVVSVLSLFAIVGLVSISKAEEIVWYCEMTQNIEITPEGKLDKWHLDKFKVKVTPTEIRFGSGGYFNNFVMKKDSKYDDSFLINDGYYISGFDNGYFTYSRVTPGYINSITAKCDRF